MSSMQPYTVSITRPGHREVTATILAFSASDAEYQALAGLPLGTTVTEAEPERYQPLDDVPGRGARHGRTVGRAVVRNPVEAWQLTGELPAIRDNDPPEWSGVDVLFSADAYAKDYTVRHRRITFSEAHFGVLVAPPDGLLPHSGRDIGPVVQILRRGRWSPRTPDQVALSDATTQHQAPWQVELVGHAVTARPVSGRRQ
jgi:hypothetical protein